MNLRVHHYVQPPPGLQWKMKLKSQSQVEKKIKGK